MKYTTLGRTSLTVSRIALGCMSYGSSKWRAWVKDEDDARPFFKAALDAGVTFFDTANMYSNGASEEVTGRALRDMAQRDKIVIATKVFYAVAGDTPQAQGLSRQQILKACDDSLRRLGTDYIDLYQIHRPDYLTNLEDTLRALDDLVRAGKVRYIGCSNLPAWQVMKTLAIARAEGLSAFRCTQSYYSLGGRELERETIPMITDQRLGLLDWSPLAGGFLTGKFRRESGDAAARRSSFDFPPVDKEKGYAIVDVLERIAGTHNATIAQVALAWVLTRDVVTSVIIGARTREQLDDNLKSIDIALSPDDLQALDEVSRLRPEYPGWMDVLPPDRLPGQVRRLERVAKA
jgi:aryl-alcohol dehydrogenase-like predicted oxidoreductase